MSLKIKLIAIFVFTSILSFSQTNVSGIINSNTTWTLASSPYTVTGNILVNTGVTLTIEAGVTIKVNSGIGIQNRGEFLAIGSASSRITFTSSSSSPSAGDWIGINLTDQSTDPVFDGSGNYLSGTIFKYVDIFYAGTLNGSGAFSTNNAGFLLENVKIKFGLNAGVECSISNTVGKLINCEISNHQLIGVSSTGGTSGLLDIDNCTIENNYGGILHYGDGIILSNSIIRNHSNKSGIDIKPSGGSTFEPLITKNVFSNHQNHPGAAVFIDNYPPFTNSVITHNVFLNNDLAVLLHQATARLDSNVFAGNNAVLIYGKNLQMSYNHIYQTHQTSTYTGFSFWGDGSIIGIHQAGGSQSLDFNNNMLAENISLDTSMIIIGYPSQSVFNLNNNNFYRNSSDKIIYNTISSSGQDIDAKNNFWGTTTSNNISNKLYDWNDDFTLSFINFSPFLTNPNTSTPISPPKSSTKRLSTTGDVALSWQANPEADVAGYKIYWGNPTGYSYDTVVDAGNVSSFTLSGISNLSQEYAVVAYDNMADGDDMDVFEGHQSWFAISRQFSPNISTSNYNGNNISCNGNVDGQISISISDGTSPYTYSWVHDPALTSNQISNLPAGAYYYTIVDSDGLSLSDSIVLTEPDTLNSTFTLTDILCAGVNSGSISFNAAGGTGSYQYSINGGNTFSNAPVFGSLSPGTYPLLVRDQNNCSFRDTITLNQMGFLNLSLDSSSNVSCFGHNDGFISVTAAGGQLPYQYIWSNGDTVEDISNLAANTYSLLVFDAAGCSQTLNHSLTEPAALQVSTILSGYNGYEISCNGAADGSVALNPNGGTTPYSYSWDHNPNLILSSLSSLTSGTYVYTITDANSCEITDSIQISEPNILTYSVSKTDVLCGGQASGSISFSLNGGVAPYQYSIDNGLSYTLSPNFTALNAGTFYTQVKDANNCLILDTISISQPQTIVITLDSTANVNCNGGNDGFVAVSVFGGALPYSYSWNNGSFSTEDIYNLSANNYTLTVTDASNCSVSMTYPVSETTLLQVNSSVSSFNGFEISCNGAADAFITLSPSGGSAPYSFLWAHDPNQTASSISNLDTGTYIYTVMDNNLCSFTDTILIEQPDSLLIQSINLNNNNCSNGADGSIKFNIIGGIFPYSYSLFDSIGGLVSSLDSTGGLLQGTYSFSVNDANGCSAMLTNIVLGYNHTPVKPFITTSDSVVCNGSTVVLSLNSGIQSVVWNDGLTSLSRNVAAGSYWLSSVDTNGCLSVSDTIVIKDLYALDTSAQICLVTYDPTLDKNRIIFDKPDNETGINSYNIYTDLIGNWQKIGTVLSGDSSQFIDQTSQPSSKVARYYIETEDQCGVLHSTINTSIHKTILLQSSLGSNNEVNLSWNQYEGASVAYYRILRKITTGNYVAIDSVGNVFNTYIDNNPPVGNTSYFIEAILNSTCSVKFKQQTYSSVSTNSVSETTIGVPENLSVDFNIFPNPTTGILHIEYLAGKENKEILLFDTNGKLIQQLESREENIKLDLSGLPKGLYYLKINMDLGVFTEAVSKY